MRLAKQVGLAVIQVALVHCLMVSQGLAADVSSLTSKEATGALRTTLERGADLAVANLGKSDGFLGNPAVRIKLPEALESNRSLLKMAGMGKQLDELEVSMNRAAEAAVPQAKGVLKKAIQNMSVEDAKQVLTGGNTAVTDFFRSKTQVELRAQLLPLVKARTAQMGLAQQYNALVQKGGSLGLVKPEEANLENHVTGKTLDALYLLIAREEQAIRANPTAAGSAVLKKVFGGMK